MPAFGLGAGREVGLGAGLGVGLVLTVGRGVGLGLGTTTGLGEVLVGDVLVGDVLVGEVLTGLGVDVSVGFVESTVLPCAPPVLCVSPLESNLVGFGFGFGGIGFVGLTLTGSAAVIGLNTVPVVGSCTTGGLLGPMFKYALS